MTAERAANPRRQELLDTLPGSAASGAALVLALTTVVVALSTSHPIC